MDSLIDHSQITYIKGRYIMDNVVCAHEVLHQVHKIKSQGVLFKIHFEKAFDKVSWDFLLETLIDKGFGSK
jgi:Reverse transcriptase (RNA-dependent DNA polymerase)